MVAKSLHLCPTLCNPMDSNLPGFSVYGISQARILEWVAMPSSSGSPWPRDWTRLLCLLNCQIGSLPSVPFGKPRLVRGWCWKKVEKSAKTNDPGQVISVLCALVPHVLLAHRVVLMVQVTLSIIYLLSTHHVLIIANIRRVSMLLLAAAKLLQSCPTLCDPIGGSPPGSPIPGIVQARTLEWVAISFSNAWKWKVKVKLLSHVQLFATPWTAAHQAPLPMGFSRLECWSGVPLLSLRECHTE